MYIENILKKLENQLSCESSPRSVFYQAVEEVFDSISPAITNIQEKNKILERLILPEMVHKFKVIWERDNGDIEVNTGYRVQFNSSLGVFKGGLRFHPSVSEDILKFLGFEQIFKNSLTGLPLGGAKGGADIDPKTMSDTEMRRFCVAFADKLNPYIGEYTDVPAGDIGVGFRELGYIYGRLKELRGHHEFGMLTGKPVEISGSLIRKEATGYGVVYFLLNILSHFNLFDQFYFPESDCDFIKNLISNKQLSGQKVSISGSGNVAIYAAEKIIELGAKVVAMSDSGGTIIDQGGIDLSIIKEIKEKNRQRISEYKNHYKPLDNQVSFVSSLDYKDDESPIWNIKDVSIALPCATQNELTLQDAKNLLKNGCKVIVEGANMPVQSDAVSFLLDNSDRIVFGPSKAANAGGVSVSYLEMRQNAQFDSWSSVDVDNQLLKIMTGIFNNSHQTALKYGNERNLVLGANVFSFERLVDVMNKQGYIS